ncbi:methyltransferase domain-containing protein [Adlercreutzia caecimuris]|uniref:Methyltransferase domain-containing protein n=1 Tax=Adlercreutzia caecimuris B7 TaxID=1235794 RepID=R9L0L2_9ACTN|nr:methyltransferase domain-containing protein [Adlercreutzia caecimuris]EOS52319.1 hypothetical protein C811_00342 [Adlercreutzia caecimuris B7]
MADDALRRHYDGLPREGGFPARCHMELPRRTLSGARVVNVGCRRGKGCYKLSELVGPTGRVTGIDWRPPLIDEARAGVSAALERSRMPRSNMTFAVAYPEQLRSAVAPESADYVYLNSSLALFADPLRALRECWAVLAPAGTLLLECAVAESEGPSAARALTVEAARHLGNAVQAAPSRAQLMGWLAEAGFMAPVLREEHEVAADRGSVFDHRVPTVPGDDATYRLVALEARKPR